MNEGPKPFACGIEGCEMTFTNEDHMNLHRKKHDMVLNLGLANKNSEVADQTPTPTRFIRTCEEFGLFQDLQNVNPFDEFFKKATEVTKSGGTLEVHEVNSEDTLHTPHILPHIEECQKNSDIIRVDENSHSNEFTLNNVITVTDNCDLKEQFKNEPIIEIYEDSKDGENYKITSSENIINNNVKLKIKQTLQSRGKQKKISNNNVISSSTKNIKIQSDHPTNRSSSPVCKEKLRAMNRAAQIRCRKRKAQKWKEMEEEIDILKSENKRLQIENQLLRRELLKGENNVEGNDKLIFSVASFSYYHYKLFDSS